jgi:hypothetical protein
MPITARLSRKFYERFGDEITDELVNWFNSVDATYRTDLRELNERNYERFDARLEQRLAQMAGSLRSEIAETRVSLIKWMFVFWTGMTVTNVGIMFALVKLTG